MVVVLHHTENQVSASRRRAPAMTAGRCVMPQDHWLPGFNSRIRIVQRPHGGRLVSLNFATVGLKVTVLLGTDERWVIS
jgi:hypothetical protein